MKSTKKQRVNASSNEEQDTATAEEVERSVPDQEKPGDEGLGAEGSAGREAQNEFPFQDPREPLKASDAHDASCEDDETPQIEEAQEALPLAEDGAETDEKSGAEPEPKAAEEDQSEASDDETRQEEDISEDDEASEEDDEWARLTAEERRESWLSGQAMQLALLDEITQRREEIANLESHAKDIEEELEHSRARLRTMNQDFSRFRDRIKADDEKNKLEALANIVLSFLPVRDNLELASEHAEASNEESAKAEGVVRGPQEEEESPGQEDSGPPGDVAVLQGIAIISRHFERVLYSLGVREVRSEGSPFDPEVHEAMSVVVREDLPEDTVFGITRRGYLLQDKLLRPARVLVSRKQAPLTANPDINGVLGNANDEDLAPAPHKPAPPAPETSTAPPAGMDKAEDEEFVIEVDLDDPLGDDGDDPESTATLEAAGTRKLAPRVYAIDLSEYDEIGALNVDWARSGEERSEATEKKANLHDAEHSLADDEEEVGFEDIE